MGRIKLKNQEEIELMRDLGGILATIVDEVSKLIRIGNSPKDLEKFVIDLCKKYDVNPSCKGYFGYPGYICVGINSQSVHCVPSKQKFKFGDIVTVDMVIDRNGWFVDHARTFIVGETDTRGELLVKVTYDALFNAIKKARIGNTIGDIGFEIEKTVKRHNFNVLRNMVGHGIGRDMHEEPMVPCFGRKKEGIELKEGMVFTIEPMVVENLPEIITKQDGWSTFVKDGGRFAMFEHTIAITKDGAIVLTKKN